MGGLSWLQKKWNETYYEDVCHLHVSLTRRLGGKCSPLYVCPRGTVRCNSERDSKWLWAAFLLHCVTCIYKLLSIVLYIKSQSQERDADGDHENKAEKIAMKGMVIGRTVIYLYFAISGFVGPGHLLLKHKQLANYFNFLAIFDQLDLDLGQFNSNALVKLITFQAPSITMGCSGIIALQQYLQFEKPGSISFPLTKLYGLTNSTEGAVLLKSVSVGVTVYEWWNLLWGLALCVTPGFCGLFVGFGAIYFGARTILIKTRKKGFPLKESMRLYRRLQVITSLTNECFQDDFALWIMTYLMAWAVITSAVLSDQQITSSLASLEFYMSLCLLYEIYSFFVIGYTFPGQAHVLSKRIRAHWRKQLVVSERKSANVIGSTTFWPALDRRIIRSQQDVKLRFGSVNFYGRMTALVVTQFVVEKSLKLMLLMKKK